MTKDYYDKKYFDWQKGIGAFGGWANSYKFCDYVKSSDTVLDFGCGGGFLLNNLNCAKRIGVEPNTSAHESLHSFNIEAFQSPKAALESLGEESVNIIISDNALEHTTNPLEELRSLRPLLKSKKNGLIKFVVPCDSVHNLTLMISTNTSLAGAL